MTPANERTNSEKGIHCMKGFIHAGKAFMSGNTLCAWKDTGTSSGKDSIMGK
jgi:hypothetical protein